MQTTFVAIGALRVNMTFISLIEVVSVHFMSGKAMKNNKIYLSSNLKGNRFLYTIQGSRSPNFGAEIRPHSQCQKVCILPNSRREIANLTKPTWSQQTTDVSVEKIH